MSRQQQLDAARQRSTAGAQPQPRLQPRPRARLPISPAGLLAATLIAIPVLLALLGPALAPHNPDATIGRPNAPAGTLGLLGTDQLGRDVLSRVLDGGRTTLGTALVAAVGAELLGVAGGITVAASGRATRALTTYLSRVLLAVPGILLLSVLVAGFGHSTLVLMVGTALALTPMLIPVIATKTATLIEEPFVEAAVLAGQPLRVLAVRELLPNLAPIIAADFAVRLLTSVFLICAAGFLGLGPAPPTPEWGLIIADAEATMQQQPWPIIAPAILLACLSAGLLLASHLLIARLTAGSQPQVGARLAAAAPDLRLERLAPEPVAVVADAAGVANVAVMAEIEPPEPARQ